ncbi:unnamed protein product [Pieris brassicae]|uniref:RNase H type-1 domain-containing protein n=1 Tax=Pieris brassicae TaxID=7116 RepID=A0A9P0TIW6_PIEBR|nr:unnamed protein product [Pieris brassicae]
MVESGPIQSCCGTALSTKLLRRNLSVENYLILKEKTVAARKLIRKSWQIFCESLNSKTTSSEMWRKMRRIKGSYSKAEQLSDSEALAFLTKLTPDGVNMPPYDHIRSQPLPTPNLFKMPELMSTLKRKDTSAGQDSIVYSMVSNLPQNANEILLRVWMDRRFNWTKHVNEVAQKCIPYVNILSCVGSNNNGVHPIHLRRLCISKVRSRIDYSSFLFGKASFRLLQKLDTIQNRCLRTCGGFIRSTPVYYIQSELCIPPLCIRRNYLSDKFFLKIASRIDDYCFTRLSDFHNLISFGTAYWRGDRLPLLHNSYSKLKDLEISKYDMWPSHRLPFLVSSVVMLRVTYTHIDDITEPKSKFSSYELKEAADSMLRNRYSDSVLIFTDGSKADRHNGCSFYDSTTGTCAKFNVDNVNIPIMGLELLAISEALQYLRSTDYKKVTIFTDSKSSLLHLVGCTRGKLGRRGLSDY